MRDVSESWRGSETVLLVEDEEAVRELTREFLEGRGYKVMEAMNGVDALEAAEKYPGRIDLLVTDVIMPGMNGPELAQQLGHLHPETAVLYVSGYSADAVPHGIMKLKAPFLPKPFSRDTLLKSVRETIDKAGRGSTRTEPSVVTH